EILQGQRSREVLSPNVCLTVSILDKFAWECITEIIKNLEWLRSRIADLRKEAKPPVDVTLVTATIADIQTQMQNLFALAQHANTQKTIDPLGMMMQGLEKQKLEAYEEGK